MGDITTRDGWFAPDDDGWEAYEWPKSAPATVPCIVVTGDLDTAKRRLATPTDVKQAALDAALATDDTRTRAIEEIRVHCGLQDAHYTAVFPRQAVDALIAAGLLGSGPSNLDKLAAWADKHGALFGIDRCTVGGESLYLAWVEDSACQRDGETATDPQAAAGAVLARLQEQTDG